MSHVFISYSKQDRKHAKDVATRLIQEGWSVFWDRTIPVGSTWDEVLEKELNSARVIVTLWSKNAVASEWVRSEAAEGANRRILVPAVLEVVTVPIRFRLLQTADISDYKLGEPDTEGMQLLIEAIARVGNLKRRAEVKTRRRINEETVHTQSYADVREKREEDTVFQQTELTKNTKEEIYSKKPDKKSRKQTEQRPQSGRLTEQDLHNKKGRTRLKELFRGGFISKRSLFICLAVIALISIVYVVVQNVHKKPTKVPGYLSTNSKTVEDVDGNVYNTVIIGTQTWMAENLQTTKYNDGTAILLVSDGTAWNYIKTSGYCLYNNFAGYKNSFGTLYNWYTVNTGKLCPIGWHVPDDSEWTDLITFLKGDSVAGGKLKETGTIHWRSPNTGATNESGFAALPGGTRYSHGSFYHTGYYGYWWSATKYKELHAWYRSLSFETCHIERHYKSKTVGFSVRCIKD